jgi:hypothetical protein
MRVSGLRDRLLLNKNVDAYVLEVRVHLLKKQTLYNNVKKMVEVEH